MIHTWTTGTCLFPIFIDKMLVVRQNSAKQDVFLEFSVLGRYNIFKKMSKRKSNSMITSFFNKRVKMNFEEPEKSADVSETSENFIEGANLIVDDVKSEDIIFHPETFDLAL